MSDEINEGEAQTETEPGLEAIIAPASEEAGNIDPPKKRRGRPPNSSKILDEKAIGNEGPKEKRTYKKKSDAFIPNVDNLARQIQGLHFIAVKMSGFQELAIDEKEAVMLAESIVNVAREYDLSMSGKTGAMIQLIGVSAMVYLPRLILINERKKHNNVISMDVQQAA